MGRRRSAEIQVFSLSFLDLLCCALAGVVVLWVLLERPEPPAKPPEPFAIVSVSQFGGAHLVKLEVTSHPTFRPVIFTEIDPSTFKPTDFTNFVSTNEIDDKNKEIANELKKVSLDKLKINIVPGTTDFAFLGRVLANNEKYADIVFEFHLCNQSPNPREFLHPIKTRLQTETAPKAPARYFEFHHGKHFANDVNGYAGDQAKKVPGILEKVEPNSDYSLRFQIRIKIRNGQATLSYAVVDYRVTPPSETPFERGDKI